MHTKVKWDSKRNFQQTWKYRMQVSLSPETTQHYLTSILTFNYSLQRVRFQLHITEDFKVGMQCQCSRHGIITADEIITLSIKEQGMIDGLSYAEDLSNEMTIYQNEKIIISCRVFWKDGPNFKAAWHFTMAMLQLHKYLQMIKWIIKF